MAKFLKTKTCCTCSNRESIFNLLTDNELNLIEENRLEVNYGPDEIIFKQGTSLTHLLSLNKGLIKVYVEGYNDRNLILGFIKPGEFICGPGAFVDKLNHYSVTAIQASSACLIDIETVKKIMSTNNAFAMAYINHISKLKIFDLENLVNLTQKQMHGRIANALMYLHNEIFKSPENIIYISRQDLADLTGMNKDSAGRILKEFFEGKIIELDKYNIKILNFNLLKQIAYFG